MATKEKTYDDLTQMKGIGKKRQTWLQEEMHVYRYADLATLSAEELETRLRETGQPVSRNTIQDWIDQATKLMDPMESGEEKTADTTLDNEDIPNSLPERIKNWHPIASFVIEYQERVYEGQKQLRTKAHHVEADNEETWSGVVQEPLCQWMQKEAGVHPIKLKDVVEDTPISEENSIRETEDSTTEKVTQKPIKITQLLVYQPPQSDVPVAIGEPERPFMGTIQADKPCTLAVQFETTSQKKTHPGDIVAELYACNLTAHSKMQVPATSKGKDFLSDTPSDQIKFANTSLPAGTYRFEIIAREDRPFSNISYLESPMLQVSEQ